MVSFDTGEQSSLKPESWRRTLLGCVAVIAILIAGWALRATSVLLVPLVFSMFLALLVAPLDRWGKARTPDRVSWLGHVAAMGAILLVIVALLGCIWLAAQRVVDRVPMGSGNPGGLFSLFEPADAPRAATLAPEDGGSAAEAGSGDSLFQRVRQLVGSAGSSLRGQFGDWVVGHAMTILNRTGATLGTAIIVFFLTLMMLAEGPRWRAKIASMCSEPARETVLDAVATIASLLRRYLLARTLIGVITAVLYVAWLWLFGVDLLLVWGFLAFALNYIPTIGSLLSGVFPVLFAFVQKDFGTALSVGAGIFVIEQIMGNYVDPRIQGRQVSLSPLVILVALLFWAWIWGIPGAFLAVPMTIAVAIIAAHIRPLRPLALMLSNETELDGLDRMTSR